MAVVVWFEIEQAQSPFEPITVFRRIRVQSWRRMFVGRFPCGDDGLAFWHLEVSDGSEASVFSLGPLVCDVHPYYPSNVRSSGSASVSASRYCSDLNSLC